MTSLTFGGDEFADLFVTSAMYEADPDDPDAGALFRVDPSNVKGTAEFTSNISA